jgi:hypothetical protein
MSTINVDVVSPQSGSDVTVNGNLLVTGTNNIRPYKVYSALLSQAGTNPPTAIVLLNELGFIGFSYGGPGIYNIISNSEFTINKTSIDGNNVNSANGESIAYSLNSINNCRVVSRDVNGVSSDDILDDNFVEIRLYN